MLVHRILNRLLQVIHVAEVLFPILVNDRQGNVLFNGSNELLPITLQGFFQITHDSNLLDSICNGHHNVLDRSTSFFLNIFEDRKSRLSNLCILLLVKVKSKGIELLGKFLGIL